MANALVSSIGGTFAYGTVSGDSDARIAQFKTVAGTTPLFPNGRAWVGLKSNYWGTASNFQPVWKFAMPAPHLGVVWGTVSTTDDAQAYSGTAAVTYAAMIDDTEQFLVSKTVATYAGTVTANIQAYRGDYLCLLRARVAGSAEYLLRIGSGYLGDYDLM